MLNSFIILNVLYFLSMIGSKTLYQKIDNHATYNKILNEGLFHFTSLESTSKIVDTNEVKASNVFASYGSKKSFFFAGIPSFDKICQNLPLESIDYVMYAVKIDLAYDQLAQFKVRSYNDDSIAYDGNCPLNDKQVKQVRLAMTLDDKGNIVYEENNDLSYKPSIELLKKLNLNKSGSKLKIMYNGLKNDFLSTYVGLKKLLKKHKLSQSSFVKMSLNDQIIEEKSISR